LNVDASRHTHIGMNVMVTGGSLLIKGDEILGTGGRAHPATVWTPFATEPVAGKPAVVCTP
jgi:hypothetical protein